MHYKKEDLVLLNMKKLDTHSTSGYSQFRTTPKIFEIEKNMTVDEKIAFIDEQRNGIASYLIDLFTKWETDRGSLPQGAAGNPKTVPIKAWLRRNDTMQHLRIQHGTCSYYLFGEEFKTIGFTCPTTPYGYDMVYTGKHIAEQWFHVLLLQLYREEQKYFQDNDPYELQLKKVRELGRTYSTVFNSEELNDIVWNSKKDVPKEHLDAYIDAYAKLKQATDDIQAELHTRITVERIES